jgi:ligand-binding sensor domain-containing protein
MVGSALASVLLMALGALTMFGARSFGAMANYVDLDQYSRNALDRMSKEIRQCNCLLASDDNYLWFQDSDGLNLLYYYIPSTRILYRFKDNGHGWQMDSKPLLTQCDFLQFSIFQRNPIMGTYNQYPTASADTCKLVQLSWVCSRTLIGNKNTESVQSAKVVIRKK